MINMEKAYRSLKTKYERFLRDGAQDPLALKADIEKLLAEARAKGNHTLVEELEEILIDLTFSAEEMKCNCPMSKKCQC